MIRIPHKIWIRRRSRVEEWMETGCDKNCLQNDGMWVWIELSWLCEQVNFSFIQNRLWTSWSYQRPVTSQEKSWVIWVIFKAAYYGNVEASHLLNETAWNFARWKHCRNCHRVLRTTFQITTAVSKLWRLGSGDYFYLIVSYLHAYILTF